MKLIPLAEPCRNFSIFNGLLIPCDPKDGREKYAFVNYAADNIGSLHIVDTETLEGESWLFPDDAGAWAMQWLPDRGELVIGTCDRLGCLHSFDMASRTFREPLRLESETYLWDFALGKDGCVYAGTYPGCVLVKYDPERRTLEKVGRVGSVSENQYTRPTRTNADGNILVGAGFFGCQVWMWDIQNEQFIKIGQDGDRLRCAGEDFICLTRGKDLVFLDAFTHEELEPPLDPDKITESASRRPSVARYLESLRNPICLPGLAEGTAGLVTASGARIGIRGQEVFRYQNGHTKFLPIPGDPPATSIMTIVAYGRELWGSSENGQTLFRYDPSTGTYENTLGVVKKNGGEVYGIVPFEGKLFLTSYAGGDHLVYDPREPWNLSDDVNPRSLGSVAPEMIRPHAKSILGADGGIWTGWYANYGSYGGGVSRIDPHTLEVKSWFDLIPGQAVEHIAAGKDALFIVTSGEASGMERRADCFHVAKLNFSGNILCKRAFPAGITFRRVAVADGKVYATLQDPNKNESRIWIGDETSLEELNSVVIGDASQQITDVLLWEDRLLTFSDFEAQLYALPDCRLLDSCPVPGWAGTSARTEDGQIFCAIRRTLYRVDLKA